MSNPEKLPLQENAAEMSAVDREREQAMRKVVSEYLDAEDAEFLDGLDPDDQLGYLYGRLLAEGEDPDVILIESGVLEDRNEV